MAESKAGRRGGAATLPLPNPKEGAQVASDPNKISRRSQVDMKEAVKVAISFIEEYYPEAKDILLEEVALESGRYEANVPGATPGSPAFLDNASWRVVVSFKSGKPGTLSEIMGGDPRLYREVHIERESGDIRSMVTWGR